MKDMRICGSCYNLVTADDNTIACPRCKKALEPSAIETLEKFIEKGTDVTKGGVRLSEAQNAASKVLIELDEARIRELELREEH